MSPRPKHSGKKKETHYSKSEKPSGGSRSGGFKSKSGFSDKPYGEKSGDERKTYGRSKPAFGADSKKSEGRPNRGGSDRDSAFQTGKSYEKRTDRPFEQKEKRPYGTRSTGENEGKGDRKPYSGRKTYGSDKPESVAGGRFNREDRPSGERKSYGGDKKPFNREGGERSERKSYDRPEGGSNEGRNNEGGERKSYGERKPFTRDGNEQKERPTGDRKPFRREEGNREKRRTDDSIFREPREEKEHFNGPRNNDNEGGENEETIENKPKRERIIRKTDGENTRPFNKKRFGDDKPREDRGERPAPRGDRSFKREERPFKKRDEGGYEDRKPAKPSSGEDKGGELTLNKFLAHAGVSSRREAGEIVKQGKVTVNGEVVLTPGYRVKHWDKIELEGKPLKTTKDKVYILLNKPKDFLTTTEDDRGRRTVMELVASAGVDRIYPVGRLDRNTTGVLIMTNDGDLAQKLSHPKHNIKKIYQVTLDKDLTKKDFDQILSGITLEDGEARVDLLAYLEKKNEVGLEIHSGRNRIVRRIFESLGYDVVKLDRVMYAGLTKKNVGRGEWRFLTEREVVLLKHFKN